jgi:hypothetical protein
MIANAKHIRMSVEFIDHKGLKQEVPENKYGRFILVREMMVEVEVENLH